MCVQSIRTSRCECFVGFLSSVEFYCEKITMFGFSFGWLSVPNRKKKPAVNKNEGKMAFWSWFFECRQIKLQCTIRPIHVEPASRETLSSHLDEFINCAKKHILDQVTGHTTTTENSEQRVQITKFYSFYRVRQIYYLSPFFHPAEREKSILLFEDRSTCVSNSPWNI